jgi:hypothetical protein
LAIVWVEIFGFFNRSSIRLSRLRFRAANGFFLAADEVGREREEEVAKNSDWLNRKS